MVPELAFVVGAVVGTVLGGVGVGVPTLCVLRWWSWKAQAVTVENGQLREWNTEMAVALEGGAVPTGMVEDEDLGDLTGG